jgi:hypothetical protein
VHCVQCDVKNRSESAFFNGSSWAGIRLIAFSDSCASLSKVSKDSLSLAKILASPPSLLSQDKVYGRYLTHQTPAHHNDSGDRRLLKVDWCVPVDW